MAFYDGLHCTAIARYVSYSSSTLQRLEVSDSIKAWAAHY